jgi:hypothetical protein
LLSITFVLKSAATATAAVGERLVEQALCEGPVLCLLYLTVFGPVAYFYRNDPKRPLIEVTGNIDFRPASARVVLRLAAANHSANNSDTSPLLSLPLPDAPATRVEIPFIEVLRERR